MNGTSKILNRTCLVSIDVESDFAENKNFEGVENLDKILNVFKKHDAAATLFVTGNVLEKYPEKIKEWKNSYEIASHSFSHKFWNTLSSQERKEELERFINLYQKIFQDRPLGFRAPSHLIDEEGLELLTEKGFLYDSSVVPHYPFFKKYRGYRGKAPLLPYWPSSKNRRKKGEMKILEIPVSGQICGFPLAGVWIARLPFWFYKVLFKIHRPPFLTVNIHPWEMLETPSRKSKVSDFFDNLDKLLKLLKFYNYRFLSGKQIYESISANRR